MCSQESPTGCDGRMLLAESGTGYWEIHVVDRAGEICGFCGELVTIG